MALTTEQIAALVDITLRPKGEIEVQIETQPLIAEQESRIAEDIETWEGIKDSHLKTTGEVDFDNERKRKAIRNRIMSQLGFRLLPALS